MGEKERGQVDSQKDVNVGRKKRTGNQGLGPEEEIEMASCFSARV